MSDLLVSAAIPRLQNGDALDRDEFERRYHTMPDVKKAELIEGVVYMSSPVRTDVHGQPHALLTGWLVNYFAATPGLIISDNGSVRLDSRNEPQPDLSLLIDRSRGGRHGLDPEGYIDGSPDLVCEVAASSASIDRNAKFRAYQRNGVREYILCRTEDVAIDWFVLRGKRYRAMVADPSGILRSEAFPGLHLDPAAMLRGDIVRVLAVLQQGITTPEHAAFVESLRQPPAP
jgi:Uma2 family endonuclease